MSKNDEIKIDDIMFDENELLNSIAEENDVDDVDVVDDVECTPDYTKVVKKIEIDDALFQKIRNEIDSINYTVKTGMSRSKIEERAVKMSLQVITKYIDFDYKLLYSDEYEDTRENIVTTCLETFQNFITQRNESVASSTQRYRYPDSLSPDSIAFIILQSKDVRIVRLPKNKRCVENADKSAKSGTDKILGIRIHDENDISNGLFVFNESKTNTLLNKIISNFAYKSDATTLNTITANLEANAKIIKAYSDINLVIANNGIFNCDKQTFTEFFTEEYNEKYGDIAFTYKSPVNYNPNACDVSLPLPDGSTFSVKMMLNTTFDNQNDSEVLVKALCQLINHLLRGDGEGFAVFLTNMSGAIEGGGGKSTWEQIFRNILGETSTIETQIDDYDKDHALDGIIGKSAIIADESESADKPVSSRGASVFKKLCTGDPIVLIPKYQSPVTIRFTGCIVQALNNVPRFRAADNALYRRILNIPFEKKFANVGEEMKIIKREYIYRQDVLEYIFKMSVEMGVCSYSKDVLQKCNGEGTERLKEESEVVYKFMNVLTSAYPGNSFEGLSFVPAPLLFDMFHIWYKNENNADSLMQSNQFNRQLRDWVKNHAGEWKYREDRHEETGKIKNIRISKNYNGRLYMFNDFPAGDNWFKHTASGTLEWHPRKNTCGGGLVYIGDGLGENRDIITSFSTVKNAAVEEKFAEDARDYVKQEAKRITEETSNKEDVTA